jgi:hypothetical protein
MSVSIASCPENNRLHGGAVPNVESEVIPLLGPRRGITSLQSLGEPLLKEGNFFKAALQRLNIFGNLDVNLPFRT